MKKFIIFFVLFAILFSTVSDGKQRQTLHITSLIIKFDKTDAIFTINYDINKFPKIYILLFGSKNIVPEIKDLFSNFDYEIVKMDQDKTILKVKNISRLDKGYYLHESIKFGETIEKVEIYSSDSTKPREYINLNSTPPFFYR